MERKNIELTEIWLQADEVDDVEPIAAMAENIVAQSAHRPASDYDGESPDLRSSARPRRRTRSFNFIMVGIASFSLVVGGIGIMNIMLATVTERTREIGIRRALGAKQRHITLQFLIETTVISLTGGLIGIGIGTGVAKLLPMIANNVPHQHRHLVGRRQLRLSGVIGIGFGLYPAIKAAQMNPIEALRHE